MTSSCGCISVLPQIQPFSFGDEPANAGDMSVVQCAVVKGDSPITISWIFNGVEITPGYQGILLSKTNQRISTLSIEAVRAHHSGEYTCRARNAAGEVEHTVHLNVNGTACIYELFSFWMGKFFPSVPVLIVLLDMAVQVSIFCIITED
jgi:hypothetical protein